MSAPTRLYIQPFDQFLQTIGRQNIFDSSDYIYTRSPLSLSLGPSVAPTPNMSGNSSDNQPATPAKLPDLIEDGCVFRANDMELLKTGRFSDAQVAVGDRVWNVHKSIVCLRSGFFDEALSGAPNAGEVPVFNILDYTEKEVELLLEFIYSGSQ